MDEEGENRNAGIFDSFFFFEGMGLNTPVKIIALPESSITASRVTSRQSTRVSHLVAYLLRVLRSFSRLRQIEIGTSLRSFQRNNASCCARHVQMTTITEYSASRAREVAPLLRYQRKRCCQQASQQPTASRHKPLPRQSRDSAPTREFGSVGPILFDTCYTGLEADTAI